MLKNFLKVVLIAVMLLGLALTIVNFISVDSVAMKMHDPKGTVEYDGSCTGLELDC